MLVYEGIKSEFINDVNLNLISNKIYDKYKSFFGRTNDSQLNSWKNSMQYMRGVLDDNGIPNNAGVAIEFNIPTTSKRIDFILSGRDSNKNDSVIIIELKQWETCKIVENKNDLVETFTGHALREVPHPSYQAWSYASLINNFNQTVQDENIGLYPCAFLHNYDLKDNDPINDIQYKTYINEAPLFGSKDFDKLRNFIKKYISEGDNRELLYKIENGKIKPSKMLQDSFASILKGNKEFFMIDEQKVIYEDAIRSGIDTVTANLKTVMIVEGGPGTGKSVLAINLLNEFMQRGMTSFYITKNSAPRDVFKSKLKIEKMSGMNNLFQSSGSYTESSSNDCQVLIVDEAHRLNEKSGLFQNKGENQIKEIINAANFSIFFIDENQKVTTKDIGSIELIKKYAKDSGAGIIQTQLESQFRCNGSDGYIAWLDNLLEIRETANYESDVDYDFRVFDDPNEMRRAIEEKNKINNKSRIVSGYCWEWPKENRNNPVFNDITIPKYNFGISWNLEGGELFAVGSDSVKQAGCIHTVQGLEFDYVGVIIGDDLRYENEHIITDHKKRAKTDKSLKGISQMLKENPEGAKTLADQIIKNTYRTLMTRGMKGCYIYCTDIGLQEYIKAKLDYKIVKNHK